MNQMSNNIRYPLQRRREKLEDQGEAKRVEHRGFPGYLTKNEHEALEEFRALAQEELPDCPLHYDDGQLLRYLRARDFKVKKAMKMLARHAKWRVEEDFPEGRKYKVKEFPTLYRFHLNGLVRFAGKDKEGHPVLILKNALSFPREIKDMSEVMFFFVAYMDSVCRYCQACGVYEFVAIADLQDFSVRHNFSMTLTRILTAMLQNHYNESLYRALLVNTPWGFSGVWNMISPLLEERVKAKVKVFDKSHHKLLEFIDADQLPTDYGGNHPGYPVPDIFSNWTLGTEEGGTWTEDSLFPPNPDDKSLPPNTVGDGGSSAPEISANGVQESSRPEPPASPATVGSDSGGTGKLKKKNPKSKTTKAVKFDEGGSGNSSLQKARSSSSLGLQRRNRLRDFMSKWTPSFSIGSSQANLLEGAGDEEQAEVRTRILVMGATGRTGMLLVRRALQAGIDVTAFVRPDSTSPDSDTAQADLARLAYEFGSDRLTIVEGISTNDLDLDRAMEFVDDVVSVIGAQPSMFRMSKVYPEVTKAILNACKRNKVKRLVVVSAVQAASAPGWTSLLSNMGTKMLYNTQHWTQMAAMEELVISDHQEVDFTIIRSPAKLVGSEAQKKGSRTMARFSMRTARRAREDKANDDDIQDMKVVSADDTDGMYSLASSSAELSREDLASFVVHKVVLPQAYRNDTIAIASNV